MSGDLVKQLRASWRWVSCVFFAPVIIVWLGAKEWHRMERRLRQEEHEAFGLSKTNVTEIGDG
jgi:hypothetical protein